MEGDRSWMYGPRYVNKRFNPVFVKGVEDFFDYAFSIPDNVINENYIRCPCAYGLTQDQINVISSQVLASVETKLDQFFKRTNKKLKLMVSHALTNQGSSSSHHTSLPNIEDDVRDEGEDDDSDYLDDDV